MEQLPTIIGSLILLGVVWIARGVTKSREELVEIRTVLTGPDGQSGMYHEQDRHRTRLHELGDALNATNGELALIAQRVTHLEEAS